MKSLVTCLLLIAAAIGCHKTKESVDMSETDPNKGAAKLEEAVRKAGDDASAVSSLHFEFHRGHEMSGITTFTVEADGSFSLARTAYKAYDAVSVDGMLSAEQIQTLYGAVSRVNVLDIESSTRAIGDDEQPISLEIGDGQSSHKLVIWAKDARENAQFSAFSTTVYALFDTLSDGAIKLRP